MTPTFSMPSVVLPLELHDYIIDFLHDETDELKRTALVCRYWLSSSRFHLFSTVTLLPPLEAPSHSSSPSPCKRLESVLAKSPDVSRYIQDLSLYEGSRHGRMGWAWMHAESSLPKLLEAVEGSLTTLCIQADPRERPPLAIRLARFPESLAHVFGRLAEQQPSFTSLRHLRLKGLTLPSLQTVAALVAAMPALKDLDLVHIRASSTEEVAAYPEVSGSRKAELESLQVISRDADGFIRCLLHEQGSASLFHLRSLAYTTGIGHMDVVNDILRACPNSLESFELFASSPLHQIVQAPPRDDTTIPDLSRNPAIRTILLDGDILPDSCDILHFSVAVLSTFPPSNVLEHFSLTIALTCRLPAPTLDDSLASCARLDALLAESGRFPRVERVRVDFRIYEYDREEEGAQPADVLAGQFLARLSRLDARGLLYADVSSV
ncbi:hypothetical protein K525DRAFT_285771 [Schizophyllum commune Loenen D]|nr:hypothetical protein K525DRAFT_285771 [Schizophyllum commune Loenen D]